VFCDETVPKKTIPQIENKNLNEKNFCTKKKPVDVRASGNLVDSDDNDDYDDETPKKQTNLLKYLNKKQLKK